MDGTENYGQVESAFAVVEKGVEPFDNVSEEDTGGNGTKVACAECEQMRKERDEFEAKYKELKRMYVKLTMHHAELDLKHTDLEKIATGKRNENNDDTNAAPADDIFTPNELKYLRCMPFEKKKDSTFVLQCLQFSYKNETSVMVNKSLKGTREWTEIADDGNEVHHPAKQPLSPHKVSRIKEVFVERISKCQINHVEYGERVKETYINKLFATGIKNISKKQH